MSEVHSKNLVAVIMAGGSGTRLRPLSTPEKPKQFHRFFGDRTLLQSTWDRLEGLVPQDRVLVSGQARHLNLIRQQLPQIAASQCLLEPLSRNTAVAVTLAAVFCRHQFGDAFILTVPSDHWIEPTRQFHKTVEMALEGLQNKKGLFLLGAKLDRAATEYGYLHCRAEVDENRRSWRPLEGFTEKPDLQTAKAYLESGEYFWNSGIFLWQVSTILAEVEEHLPEHFRRLSVLKPEDFGNRAVLAAALEPLENISVDYGVLEKSSRLFMVEALFSWSDLGTWEAVKRFQEDTK